MGKLSRMTGEGQGGSRGTRVERASRTGGASDHEAVAKPGLPSSETPLETVAEASRMGIVMVQAVDEDGARSPESQNHLDLVCVWGDVPSTVPVLSL